MPERIMRRIGDRLTITGVSIGTWLYIEGTVTNPTPLQARSSIEDWWIYPWWLVLAMAVVSSTLAWCKALDRVEVGRVRLSGLLAMLSYAFITALGAGRAVFSLIDLGQEGLVGAGLWTTVSSLALGALDRDARTIYFGTRP